MAIKLKRISIKLIAAMVALVLLTVGVLATFPVFSKEVQDDNSVFENWYFTEELYEASMALYWDSVQKASGESISPDELFLPNIDQPENWEQIYDDEEMYYYVRELQETCRYQIINWRDNFNYKWRDLDYVVVDAQGNMFGNWNAGLEALALNPVQGSLTPELQGQYRYIAVLHYDSKGTLSIPVVHGAVQTSFNYVAGYNMWDHWNYMLGNVYYSKRQMTLPQDFTVVYAVPKYIDRSHPVMNQQYYSNMHRFSRGNFLLVYMGALVLAALVGILYGFRRDRRDSMIERIPLEAFLLFGLYLLYTLQSLSMLAVSMDYGQITFLTRSISIAGMEAYLVGYGLSFIGLFLALWLCFAGGVHIHQLFHMGFFRYIYERSVSGKALRWLVKETKRFVDYIAEVDLSKPIERNMLVFAACNFVIIAIMCLLWPVGVLLAACYSAFLYAVARQKWKEMQRKYACLVETVDEMAGGKLDVDFREEAPFQQLGANMKRLQQGFRHAVEEEVKSQNMKTELVTNVSHDLKTPLTAIITYIDLLKNEDISPEERRQYIETLDNKSQRLKVLIEDLFEVSKASSGNLSLDISPVDLAELIRQTEVEVQESIQQSGIEFVHRFPDEKVILPLDGEKTSRIFQNLILNITKYAMQGTRAYVDIHKGGDGVTVEVKNISREPLDFGVADITERFVRGDRSRNTEGSGLGLAIARSFTELQGGEFTVVTDGDLFKVVVKF